MPENITQFLLLAPIIACLPPIILSPALRRGVASRLLISVFSALSSLLMVAVATYYMLGSRELKLTLRLTSVGSRHVPWPLTALSFGVDGLSGVFILMLGIVGFAASVYSVSYLRRLEEEYGLRLLAATYPAFLAFMYLVLIVRDLFWFLVFWELMTLASQFLVSAEFRRPLAVRAGLKYFMLTKGLAELMIAGGIAAMIAASLSQGTLITSFEGVARVMHGLASVNAPLWWLVTALIFAGLMVKAALVPLHNWLPDAHPEAPSNVSALLSGVMIKLGIYMMFRLFLYLTTPTIVWGAVLSAVGALTLTYGTLMALKQTDSKRLLAYHSVGQIGYIALGLGACLTLLTMRPPHPLLAAVAAFASLYHALNHSLFKSLLFLNAGAVEYVTGSRNLNALGGLGKVMPVTAVTALIASFSISGIPPFNGFVSKWLIYSSTMTVAGYLPACGFLAMFISSVTTASFIKFYTSLFGRPSKRIFKEAREVPASMLAGQIILAAGCVILGVLPPIAWLVIRPALLEAGLSIEGINAGLASVSVTGVSSNMPALIAAIMFPAAGIAYALIGGRARQGITGWACGASAPLTALSPPAKSYYEVFEEEFPWLYRAGEVLHEVVVVRGSRTLSAVLSKAQWVLESPSLMVAVAAAAPLIAALASLVMWISGVIKP